MARDDPGSFGQSVGPVDEIVPEEMGGDGSGPHIRRKEWWRLIPDVFGIWRK